MLREHLKRTLYFAYPVILSNLGHVLAGVADSVMLARVSAAALGAATFSHSIVILFMMFGIGISLGITPLVALADGQNKVRRNASLLFHGVSISIATGILLFILLLALLPALPYFGQPADVIQLTPPYYIVVSASLIPLMIFQGYKQFAEGLSHTRAAMAITLIANLINVGLNYLLIFGKAGFPELGVLGAAIATLVARVLMAGGMAVYVERGAVFSAIHQWTGEATWQWKRSMQIIRLGVPSGLQYIFEVGAFSFSAVMVGWIGTYALAAHQIALNMASISYMIIIGLGAAATVRIGNQWGKKDLTAMKTAAAVCYGLAFIIMLAAGITFYLGRTYLPSLYIDNPSVIEIAVPLLVVAAFFQLSDGTQAVTLGALRGLQDVKIPTYIVMFAYWVTGIPAGYLLAFPFDMGAVGIWLGLLIGLTLASLLLVARFLKLIYLSERSKPPA